VSLTYSVKLPPDANSEQVLKQVIEVLKQRVNPSGVLDIRRAIGCNTWSSLAQAWPCLSATPGDTSGDSE